VSEDIISLHRARLARERGTVIKDWGGKVSVALAYPNIYSLGMSNLGFQTVYRLFNDRPRVVCERLFLPEGQEMSLLLRSGKALSSLESHTPMHQFDLVAFSLSFENDYPNILKILELGTIPLFVEERPETFPLVMAGGVAAFLNPEPLASFFDFFLLGEAEASLHAFVDLWLELRSTGAERKDVLRGLARGMDSLYVPSLYGPEYNKAGTLNSFGPQEPGLPPVVTSACPARQGSDEGAVPLSAITTPDTEFGEKILIELGRGCGRSCRFCAAGYVYRPPRAYPESDLLSYTEKALETCSQVGLMATALSDVPGLENITSRVVQKGGRFSLSSLRADAVTPGLLEHLKRAGQRTISIAPEAGSERLRRVINKHLTRDQIMETVSLIARTGAFSIRLYFLIGLPTETKDDVAQIVDLVKNIKHHMVKESARRGSIGRIRLSVNCFVPKPFTPFQWFPMEHLSSLKDKQKWLRKRLSREGGVTVSFDVPRWAYVQALLSLGDRRVGAILHDVQRLGGDWKKALRSSPMNPDFFVYRQKGLDEVLPWDFIDHGIVKGHLIEEYELGLQGEESDVCNVGECHRCGVC
jgi:radical SAM superfamily enzyme YgiQ (UPF0313 family)